MCEVSVSDAKSRLPWLALDAATDVGPGSSVDLEGVKFTHMWGGVIDTSSRFSVFWGRAMSGRVAYALGYTGLGVAASRFGASVMLDLLDGRRSLATQLEFVKSRPLPFPPEPFRFVGIQATRWSLDREDKTGRRNLWLRLLDRLGLGFDS